MGCDAPLKRRSTEKEKQSLLCGRLKRDLLASNLWTSASMCGSRLLALCIGFLFFCFALFCMIDCGVTGLWGGLMSAEAPISLPAHANFCS
ncbi:hypothetical protein CDAR_18811 [Caerostris darwini]|uniref:Uncharacterized protein n=1 Tax=Caerostris darwini TaxID=1538125 RepID=A0AAV4WFT4_9ARAC|nr:hypothetical protein CDAR_18811 [Caerostris darwini]